MERRRLLSSLVVTNTGDIGDPGSLRWAIEQANGTGGPSTSVSIAFDIPGVGAHTIRLASPLPTILVPVQIDGTTQPGYQQAPLVEIDGSGLHGGGNDGLVVTAGGSTIRGLSLVGFSDAAIVLQTGGRNVVAGNYLGLTPSGSASIPNLRGLTLLGSSYNTIGLSEAGPGNVISGNNDDGVLLEVGGADNSSANLIVGNEIGTSADGQSALGNGAAGIEIRGAGGNSIGMPGQGFGNVISGNGGDGILLSNQAEGNTIQNDLVGVAVDGVTPIGNQGDGIHLDNAPDTAIGGSDSTQRNVIAANRGNGVAAFDDTHGTVVEGNAIGTDASGTLPLGNLLNGVCLGSSANSIGGTSTAAANIIAFNGSGRVGAGVQLVGEPDGDAILSNSIFSNAGMGINFGSGPTPNHAPGTPGPNDYQNYPFLFLAPSDGPAAKIDGTLFETPNTTYLIQFFSSPVSDQSGYGQGKVLLGMQNVQTDALGTATFSTSLPAGSAGQFVSATATDPKGNTSEFSEVVEIPGQIDLVVTGRATPDPVLDGGVLTYTLNVTNRGTADATGVMLTDVIPPSTTLVSVTTSQGTMMPTMGGPVTVSLGTLVAGASATVTIAVRTGAGSVGTITDTATVSSDQVDPDPTSEITTISAKVETAADVAIAMVEGPSVVLVGGDLTYTMTVTNNGPQSAANVRATLPMADGLAFVSGSAPVGTITASPGQVVAALGDLSAGQSVVVTFVVQANATGPLSEMATVVSDSLDPDLSNNSATATAQVDPAADLEISIASDTPVAAVGMPLTYTLSLTNLGPSDATSVDLTDTLPAGATFVSADVDTDVGVTPAVDDGVLDLRLSTLPAGASVMLTIVVDPTAAPGTILFDSATVAAAEADPVATNNADSVSVPVRGVTDLAIAASVLPSAVDIGQPVTYTIDVTNNGPADEPDAVLGAAIPTGLVITSFATPTGLAPKVVQGILTADLGPLLAGQGAVITLVATPGPSNVGTLTTGFSVWGQDYDSDTTNNTATAVATVAPASDLGVHLGSSRAVAVSQTNWSYTVTVSNAGPSGATGVIATIPIPEGVRFISASASQGLTSTGAVGVLEADLGAIATGGSATITVVIDPAPAIAGGRLSLSAQVTGDQDDLHPDDNRGSLVVTVAPSVSLALALNTATRSVPSGQVVRFVASVSNLGTTPATGVTVAFPEVVGLSFVGSTPGQFSPALASGQYFARLGNLAPGGSATVVIDELANVPGTYTLSASVSQAEYNLDAASASATASALVVESPGMLQFGSGVVMVTDLSGVATIPVVRAYGANGTVTLHYQTSPINATPGTDFTPVSGTLTLGPGQWTGSIQVPVLDNPHLNHDTYLNLTIDSPTGGATLGPTTTAMVHIQDVDPDNTPPRVTGLTWAGTPRLITSLTLYYSEPIDPAHATDPADYHLVLQAGGQAIPISAITYDPSRFSVTLVPQSPIRSGQYARIEVSGAGSDAIRDLAGNLLAGGGGMPGTDYAAVFAQGHRLSYIDNHRNRVMIRVRGQGYLRQVLDASGDGMLLDLVGMRPHRTTIKGRVQALPGGSGQTEIGQVAGLGAFGAVKVLLRTPPFRVTQLPFQGRGLVRF